MSYFNPSLWCEVYSVTSWPCFMRHHMHMSAHTQTQTHTHTHTPLEIFAAKVHVSFSPAHTYTHTLSWELSRSCVNALAWSDITTGLYVRLSSSVMLWLPEEFICPLFLSPVCVYFSLSLSISLPLSLPLSVPLCP